MCFIANSKGVGYLFILYKERCSLCSHGFSYWEEVIGSSFNYTAEVPIMSKLLNVPDAANAT